MRNELLALRYPRTARFSENCAEAVTIFLLCLLSFAPMSITAYLQIVGRLTGSRLAILLPIFVVIAIALVCGIICLPSMIEDKAFAVVAKLDRKHRWWKDGVERMKRKYGLAGVILFHAILVLTPLFIASGPLYLWYLSHRGDFPLLDPPFSALLKMCGVYLVEALVIGVLKASFDTIAIIRRTKRKK